MKQLSLFGDTEDLHVPALEPLIRYPGSKRWMRNPIGNLLDKLGDRQNTDVRLVEPFAGGASVSLGLGRPGTVLNDLNRDLINLYKRIQQGDWPDESLAVLEDYPKLRDEYNSAPDPWRRAELFYALSRVSFCGLIRYNSKGEFNSSKGDYVPGAKLLKNYQNLFADWTLLSADYRDLPVRETDLIFADPPYDTPYNNYQKAWRWPDHISCAEYWINYPTIVTNQATTRVVQLYRDLGYTVSGVLAPRAIANNLENAVEIIALSPKLSPDLIHYFPDRIELDNNGCPR